MTIGLENTVSINLNDKIDSDIKDTTKDDKPSKYSIIFHDDPTTTKPFVVGVLKTHFLMSQAQARRIMLEVHNKGAAKVIVVPSKDHAETKACLIMSEARKEGFPFKVTFEKEE